MEWEPLTEATLADAIMAAEGRMQPSDVLRRAYQSAGSPAS